MGTIVTLNGVAYSPSNKTERISTGPSPRVHLAKKSSSHKKLPFTQGFVHAGGDGIRLSLPAISTAPTYTTEEMQKLKLAQRSDLQVSLLSLNF